MTQFTRQISSYIKSMRSVVGISKFGNWLMFGSMIGFVAGAGAIAFTYGLNLCTDLLFGQLAQYQIPTPASESVGVEGAVDMSRRWLFLLIPAVGGLASGWLIYTFAPEAEGHGTDEVIKAFHRGRGLIRRRVPILKTLASILTIGSGGSAGREGPVAQIGAGFGSFLADLLKLPDKDRRLMVLAGMGGGIGSMFRAPLGGALFATEVLYREPDFEYEGLIPAIISAIVAYSLYGFVFGWGAIFDTPKLLFHQPHQLLLYLVFGFIAAGIGILYVRIFYGMRDRLFKKLRIPRHFRPAVGGVLLGILAFFFPPILGTGYGWIQLAIYGKITLSVMIVFPFLKILATSLTISSGGSGGVFAPSLVIGGMLGGAFGMICTLLLPDWNLQPAAFIMVGMAGFFAGIAKVPISALIMVAEMTGSYGLLVPTMLVAAVSLLLTGRTSIYEMQVSHRADSPAHRGEFLMDILDKMRVSDCMVSAKPSRLVRENLPFKELLRLVTRTDYEYFLTVDENKQLTGLIALDEIRHIMLEPHLDTFLITKDLAVPNPPHVNSNDSLSLALNLFALHTLDELPVVEDNTLSVKGVIRKKDLVLVYTQTLIKTEKKASGDSTTKTSSTKAAFKS
ncbi:MAG: chloride channel protein [Bacteroidetes bacterium]|nr:chloride channel protein [Bacteroidota bacterium]